MNPRDIKMRMAEVEDKDALASLAKDNDVVPVGVEIDWSHAATWFLLAEHEGDLIGAIQICPSRPFGRMEMMMLRSDLEGKVLGATVVLLCELAGNILKRMGVTIAVSSVGAEYQGFLQSALVRGWHVTEDARVVVKVL